MPLRALIFDVDGTLADTERDAHRVAFNRAFAETGLPFRWDVPTYGHYLKVTGGKERLRAFLNDHPQLPQLSDADIASIHRQKTGHYVEMMNAGLKATRWASLSVSARVPSTSKISARKGIERYPLSLW